MLASGCASSIRTNAPPHEAAGLIARLDAAAVRVAQRPLDIDLERRAGYGAWAWGDGRIRVTPALVAALDDDGLAAVVAHELGHLRSARSSESATAVVGGTLEAELAADRAACALLVERGIPADALVDMLGTLARAARLDLDARVTAARRCAAR